MSIDEDEKISFDFEFKKVFNTKISLNENRTGFSKLYIGSDLPKGQYKLTYGNDYDDLKLRTIGIWF